MTMLRPPQTTVSLMARCCAVFTGLTWAASAALADLPRSAPPPAAYTTECGSCHTAYPPGLLLEKDWRKTLNGLASHFGTDATPTAAELKVITSYLLANAAIETTRFATPGDPPRLTRTAWFERKHLRKLPDSAWKDPKVKSAANCNACHTRADQGSYAEGEIAVPGFPGRRW